MCLTTFRNTARAPTSLGVCMFWGEQLEPCLATPQIYPLFESSQQIYS